MTVKYLREKGLKYRELSGMTGFEEQNIRHWDKGYDEELKSHRDDLRGLNLQVTEEFIGFIVGAASGFLSKQKRRKRLKIGSFLKWLNKAHREQVNFFGCGKSRRVITEILVANGLYEERLSKKRYPSYRPRLSRYCPNAQLVIDGKGLFIEFMGERFGFNLEMAKDMISEAITGHTITDEEDAQAVCTVLEQHSIRYGDPLALLLDNDKANIKAVSEKIEGIIPIFAFKGCPETKGDIEGEFGNLVREIGTVRINGGNKRELAKGILKAIVDLYVGLRNQRPRLSVLNRAPIKLMEEAPCEEELRMAKEGLQEQQKRSLALKEGPSLRQEKVCLIEDILTSARLYVEDRERFLKTMLKYDEKVIREAEADFFVLSQKDTFSETKRTGKYFVGIVRNKQIELDRERKRKLYQKRYSLDQQWQERRESYRRKVEELKEEETLRKYPENVLLNWITITFNLKNTIGYQSSFFMDKIKETIGSLLKKHNFKERVVRLADNIMAIKDWAVEKRLEVITKVQRWIDDTLVNGRKSVTLKI